LREYRERALLPQYILCKEVAHTKVS